MHYIHRKIAPPDGSYFILGPRGTGKSTWLLHHYPKAVRIDFLLGDQERRFSGYPERVRDLVAAMQPGSTLILDEIQRVPRLLPEIHALIEQRKDIQYIMTGSSSRKLRRSVSDLLGGRALLRQMGPFLASELGTEFSEGLVAQHLHVWTQSQKEPHSLCFWRTQTQLEVDFVVYGPKGFWAIEVKHSPNLGPDDIRGSKAFKEEYPEAACFVVAPTSQKEVFRGFPVIPVTEFLLRLTPENPL